MRQSINLRTCGSFKSANHKNDWVRKSQIRKPKNILVRNNATLYVNSPAVAIYIQLVSREFRRHGIPFVFCTFFSSVFRAE